MNVITLLNLGHKEVDSIFKNAENATADKNRRKRHEPQTRDFAPPAAANERRTEEH